MGLNFRPVSQVHAVRRWPKLAARTHDVDGCWLWTGHLSAAGYGRVHIGGVEVMAHRAAYTALVGPIPEGLTLDHLCRNRACVNPAHLEPVTLAENTRRGMGHGHETHCPSGHPYDEANTRVYRGHRYCRACMFIWNHSR